MAVASLFCKVVASTCNLLSRVGVLEALGLSVPLPIAKGGTFAITKAAARVSMKLPTTVVASGTTAIDWSLTDNFYEQPIASKAYTFSNVSEGLSIQFAIYSTGAFTFTFPVGVLWPDGDAQPPSPASGESALYSLTHINGKTWGTYVITYPAVV